MFNIFFRNDHDDALTLIPLRSPWMFAKVHASTLCFRNGSAPMIRIVNGYVDNGKVVTPEVSTADKGAPRYLVTVFDETLEDLRRRSEAAMPPAKQARVSELLAAHGEGQLSAAEEQELDDLLAEAHEMDLGRAEAAHVLRELGQGTRSETAS